MSALLQGLPSPIVARGGSDTPAYTHNGLPFEEDGVLAIEDWDIHHYNQGLPFTESGRIAATTIGDVVRVGNGATPFTLENKLAIAGLADPVSHYANGVAFTADSKIAMDLQQPLENLYVNYQFVGAAAPNTPPNDHTFQFVTNNPELTVVSTGTNNRITLNSNIDSVRQILQYDIAALNPALVVGASYRISVVMRRLEGGGNAGAPMVRLNNVSNITILNTENSISIAEGSKRLYIEFSIDTAAYAGLFQFGVGLTNTNTGYVTVEAGQLIEIPTPIPTNVLTTDSGDPLTTDSGGYITAG